MKRIHWWLKESPLKRPAMLKALIMQSRDYRSSFISSIYIKSIKKYFTASLASQKRQGISLSLVTLVFLKQTVQENMKENKAPHYRFPVRRNHRWPLKSPPKGPGKRKAFIMQFRISGLHVLGRLITHCSENKWASWGAISLATLVLLQQLTQGKCKKT